MYDNPGYVLPDLFNRLTHRQLYKEKNYLQLNVINLRKDLLTFKTICSNVLSFLQVLNVHVFI